MGDTAHQQDEEEAYDFLGHRFVVGSQGAVRTYAHPSDVEEFLRQVRTARAMADRVIVSLHCHEQGGPTLLTAPVRSEVEDLADFAVDLAHRSVDAGADVFVGHGPQVPLGVEIYQGRPNFYGLGAFIFEIETLRFLPEETYERYGLGERATPADFVETRYANEAAAIRRSRGSGSSASRSATSRPRRCGIRLYPVELGFREPLRSADARCSPSPPRPSGSSSGSLAYRTSTGPRFSTAMGSA